MRYNKAGKIKMKYRTLKIQIELIIPIVCVCAIVSHGIMNHI